MEILWHKNLDRPPGAASGPEGGPGLRWRQISHLHRQGRRRHCGPSQSVHENATPHPVCDAREPLLSIDSLDSYDVHAKRGSSEVNLTRRALIDRLISQFLTAPKAQSLASPAAIHNFHLAAPLHCSAASKSRREISSLLKLPSLSRPRAHAL